MKKTTLPIALAAILGSQTSANAEPSLVIGGAVEVEASSGEESSDIAVATVEIGLASQINEKVAAEVVLLHEEDETDFSVDTATVSLAMTDNLNLTAGQTYVSFGVFGTYMISDPLTLELAETNATALQAGYKAGPVNASFYTFNGVNADEEIDNWGANLGYISDRFLLTLGYLANLGDSDTIAADSIDTEVPAMSVSAGVHLGGFSLLGEYVSALDEFQVGDGNTDPDEGYLFTDKAQPRATNLELAYTVAATAFAVGVQTTDEAEALGLAEKRILGTISHKLMKNTVIALEWASNDDYAGESSETVTAQLAVEF